MASVFGVGPVATAFKYAWVLPGFASSLLGGVNGPIHIIMSTTLSKFSKERGKKLFQRLTTIMFLVGGIADVLVYIFPEVIIHSYAAGAEGNDALPTIVLALSSSLLIVSCLICNTRRLNASSTGGRLLSSAVSLGLFLQWLTQVMFNPFGGACLPRVIMLGRGWSYIISDSFVNIFKSGDVREEQAEDIVYLYSRDANDACVTPISSSLNFFWMQFFHCCSQQL